MYPLTVVSLLGVILGTTLVQYLYIVPPAIANNGNVSNNNVGYWGASNSDFDWCERNYVLTRYIAEPWNSITSMVYVVVAILSMHHTSMRVPSSIYISDITFVTAIVILIGLGSTAFHATLLYKTQLFDEMPMHWLVSYSSVMLYTRNDYKYKISDSSQTSIQIKSKNSRNFYLYLLTTIFCVSTVIIVWKTPKNSKTHEFARFSWALTFVLGFVYCFGVCCKMANQVHDKKPDNMHYVKINQYFDKSFISFTVALVGWICDNYYCEILHNFTIYQFNIPYLHFHAFLWHIGTCVGLHYFINVVLAHRIVFQYNKDIKCTTFLGILPCIAIAQKSQ